MTSFDVDHLPFNRGWRWKQTQQTEDFVLDAGESKTMQELSLPDQDVAAGWLVFASVSSTSDKVTFNTVTELPGPDNKRRAASFTARELLNAGATEARAGLPWAEQTTVGGTDVFSIWANAFAGFAIPIRFPEFSKVEVKNPTDAQMTVLGFRVGSLLIHKPDTFFRQMRAFNLLTQPNDVKTEKDVIEKIEMTNDAEETLLNGLAETPD